MPRLFTISEAAEQLGVSPQTLRTWEKKGIINPVRLPSGYRRYTPQEVDRLKKSMGLPEDQDNNQGHNQ